MTVFGGAIDCHLHVIDPARFAFAEGPGYRPAAHESGTREDMDAVLAANGVAAAVLVQPSGYAYDNSAMLDAVRRAPGRRRAIAVIEGRESEAALARLAELGVVGARFNLASFDPAALSGSPGERLLERIGSLGWFAQVHARDDQWAAAAAVLMRSGVTTLIDHFGVSAPELGLDAPGFRAVLALGRAGRAIIKLSAPFRVAAANDNYAALDAHVEALLGAFDVERRLWGSDWPFLALPAGMAYAASLAALRRWLPDAEDRDAALRGNPARLFGFSEVAV
jgi:predicted TIM-barrel fold metal-dependent hydrolase